MTNADVALYRQALAAGGSNLPVRAGEVLTERDLLLALLLPSADNIAETLAVWVSGNRAAFIARLNATAAAMGMHHTHFADPSGLSVRTVSTAQDLVLLARAVIANPALAELVGTTAGRAARRHRPATTSTSCSPGRPGGWASRPGGPGRRVVACSSPTRRTYATGQHRHGVGRSPRPACRQPQAIRRTSRARSGVCLGAARGRAPRSPRYSAVDLSAVATARCPDRSRRAGDPARRWSLSPSRGFPSGLRPRGSRDAHLGQRRWRRALRFASGATVAEITGIVDAKTVDHLEGGQHRRRSPLPSLWWKLFSA